MRILTIILGLAILAMLCVGCNKTDEVETQAEPTTTTDTQEPATTQEPTGTETEGNMEVITTESGLQYIDLVVGEGVEAMAGQTVNVHYTGWLKTPEGEKGKKFDSSYDRGDAPASFKLGNVIAGWNEGIPGMKVGGQRRLVIPSNLAYGDRGIAQAGIPPNADMIFDVELVSVAGQ